MNIISLGAGIQSTAMLLLANRGQLLKPKQVQIDDNEWVNIIGEYEPWEVECAIFSDTGWEPQSVYDHLERLIQSVDIPVHIVSAGNIKKDMIERYTGKSKRFAAIPFFIKNPDGSAGIGRRQCTNEYKLVPVYKKTRELLGLKKYQRAPKGTKVNMLIGISTDEVTRIKTSRKIYVNNVYPFIDMRWNRQDCKRYLREIGWESTPKSACIGCPFHSNSMWQWMKDNDPDSFKEAVEIDRMLRAGKSKLNRQEYMHSSLKPLDEVVFSDKDQLNLFEMECEGMCGI